MELTYWYLFPIAILIATIANGAGIGGATFFSPLFVLLLGFEPQVAVGAALATEVFGFGSGVYAHARARTIDWRLARRLATASVPLALVGSLLADAVPATLLKVALGLGLIAIAVIFIRHHESAAEDAAIARGERVVEPFTRRQVITRDGSEYEYSVCRTTEGTALAGVGGLFVGLISTGLGELNSYSLVKRCRVPTRITVATSVAVVAVTALVASATHFVSFAREGGDMIDTVLSIILFTIPGVLVGGQLGPQVPKRIPGDTLIRSLGWLFLVIGLLTLAEALVG